MKASDSARDSGCGKLHYPPVGIHRGQRLLSSGSHSLSRNRSVSKRYTMSKSAKGTGTVSCRPVFRIISHTTGNGSTTCRPAGSSGIPTVRGRPIRRIGGPRLRLGTAGAPARRCSRASNRASGSRPHENPHSRTAILPRHRGKAGRRPRSRAPKTSFDRLAAGRLQPFGSTQPCKPFVERQQPSGRGDCVRSTRNVRPRPYGAGSPPHAAGEGNVERRVESHADRHGKVALIAEHHLLLQPFGRKPVGDLALEGVREIPIDRIRRPHSNNSVFRSASRRASRRPSTPRTAGF